MRVPQPVNDVVMFLFLPGVLLHEYTHLILGKIAGGNPYFSDYRLGVPRQVDFHALDEMSSTGVQITGGAVSIYPLILVGIVGVNLGNPFDLLRPINALATYLSLGAIGVSWHDIMAAQEPEKWKKYTAGEPISWED